MRPPISAAGISSSAGTGLVTAMPPASPSDHLACIMAASSSAESTRIGARVAALARVERRELVGADDDDRHAERLERLEGQADVEDRLHAGADDGHVGLAELGQVGGDVEARLGAAVHATEAAGDEDADAGQGGQPHGAGDRGGAVGLAGDDVGEVAEADLGDVGVGREGLELVAGQADPRAPRRGWRSWPAWRRRRG